MNVCVLWLKTPQALGNRRVSLAIQLKVHWNIYNAKIMYTALVTSMRRGVPAGSESYPWIPLICLHQWLRLAKGSIPWWCEGKRRTYKHPFVPLVGTGGWNLSSYCPRFWLRLSGHQQAHVRSWTWWRDSCYIVFVEVVVSRGSVPYASRSQVYAPCSCCGQT